MAMSMGLWIAERIVEAFLQVYLWHRSIDLVSQSLQYT